MKGSQEPDHRVTPEQEGHAQMDAEMDAGGGFEPPTSGL